MDILSSSRVVSQQLLLSDKTFSPAKYPHQELIIGEIEGKKLNKTLTFRNSDEVRAVVVVSYFRILWISWFFYGSNQELHN